MQDGVRVGPYAIIAPHVKIESGTTIGAFAQVLGYTEIGQNCTIFSQAVVGSPPQDLKYKQNQRTYLTIGNGNTIREFVTINPGTDKGSKTTIGNDNLIMAYSHIAHNCIVGNNNVFANCATLAGHVEVQDKVVMGGLVAVHQFCRVGSFSIIGGCSKVVQDIPPYSMCDGHPAKAYSLNLIGLRRAGFSREKIGILKKAFKVLFFESHSIDTARQIVKDKIPACSELDYLVEFILSSKRGISK